MGNELTPERPDKQTLKEWLESFLPFSLPSILLVRTAANFDRAIARLVVATGDNLASRIDRSTHIIAATGRAAAEAVESAQNVASQEILAKGPLAQRAIHYTYRDSILKQQNRENIARLASEELKDNPPKEEAEKDIDADWLANFARFSETASDAAVQSLWAKILAGEIKSPGAFRLRTLQEVSVLSKDDAMFIHRVLSCSIDNKFIFRDDDTFKFGEMLSAEHLGMVSVGGGMLSWQKDVKQGAIVGFQCGSYAVRMTVNKDGKLEIPAYPLTIVGREVAAIAGSTNVDEGYIRRFGMLLKAKKMGEVQLLKLDSYDRDSKGYPILNKETL